MARWVQTLGRISAIAGSTLRAWSRQHFFAVGAVFLLILVGALRVTRTFRFGSAECGIAVDLILGCISVLGGGMAMVVPAHMVVSEVEMGTMRMLMAKGVRGYEYVTGSIVGHGLALSCLSLLLALGPVMFFPLWATDRVAVHLCGSVGGWKAFALTVVMAWIKLIVIATISLAAASCARSAVMALVQALCLVVVCHLHEVMEAIQLQGSNPSIATMLSIVRRMTPDLAAFSLADQLGSGHPIELLSTLHLISYGLACVLFFGALSAVMLRKRRH